MPIALLNQRDLTSIEMVIDGLKREIREIPENSCSYVIIKQSIARLQALLDGDRTN